MANRFDDDQRWNEGTSSFDPLVHRSLLIALIFGLVASIFRLIVSLHHFYGEIFPFSGSPISIAFDGILVLVLWRRPQSLRTITVVSYAVLMVRIAFQLIYNMLLLNYTVQISYFVGISGLMSISYVLPFMLWSRRLATVLVFATLGVWVIITGTDVVTHMQTHHMRQMVVAYTQLYFGQVVLIIFMALYPRLRGLYVASRSHAHQMERIANTDFLLGIANRRATEVQLESEIEIARNNVNSLSIVLIDIDRLTLGKSQLVSA